ncbi:MAG: hypothetical protein AMS18_16240 [Gemmatimonas sp. SG8_17]|nr:MAG: hypothetical protein AMS18_16240 [Gemmatimonas sp. SG8_17]
MKVTKTILASAIAALMVILMLTQVGFAAKQPSDKIYWMTISEVPVERLQQFHELSAETIIPLFEDHGCRWVASWQTVIGDVEEVVNVVEFETIDAYHRAKVSLLASSEWEQLSSELRPLVRSSKQLLLSATQYSPLR